MTLIAGMTAFYMFRMYYLVFWWNNPDYAKEHHGHMPCMTRVWQ